MTWVGASWTSAEPVWKPALNCQNLVTWIPYIAIWWINSKIPEGSMITSENSSVARESSRVIILKSCLNSTGHSACTSKVRDIFDRHTHVPNDWWQLMGSHVPQPWDHRNSMTAPVRNITQRLYDDVISAANDLFDQWDPISVTLKETVCGPLGGQCGKIKNYIFNSSNWGQKSKTRVSYWWRYISLFAHAFSLKCIHSPTWKLKKKTNALVNVPKKETHHESDDLNRISSREFTCLLLFALLVTHKEKRQSRMPVNLKKTEFAPAVVQAKSSSHTFHPEATGAGGKVQSKKLYRLKRKLLHLQY